MNKDLTFDTISNSSSIAASGKSYLVPNVKISNSDLDIFIAARFIPTRRSSTGTPGACTSSETS
jgi:hypothetical protein